MVHVTVFVFVSQFICEISYLFEALINVIKYPFKHLSNNLLIQPKHYSGSQCFKSSFLST